MRVYVLMASLALFSCGENVPTNELTSDGSVKSETGSAQKTPREKAQQMSNSEDEILINRLLLSKEKGLWHVLNDREAGWMKGVFDYFIAPKRKEIPDYPYITKGDFNADGRQDLAAVVTNDKKEAYQIAIITDTSKITFWKEDILEDAAVSAVPGSTIEGFEGEKTKKIKMKGDGINVEYFERASFVIYWTGTAYKRIQTGD